MDDPQTKSRKTKGWEILTEFRDGKWHFEIYHDGYAKYGWGRYVKTRKRSFDSQEEAFNVAVEAAKGMKKWHEEYLATRKIEEDSKTYTKIDI